MLNTNLRARLFKQVQISQIFTDGKTFVDAIPKQTPQLIEPEYLKHKKDANFNFKAFVNAHFTPYNVAGKPYTSNILAGVRKHIDTPAGGREYPLQDGFGRTNGALLKLMDTYK